MTDHAQADRPRSRGAGPPEILARVVAGAIAVVAAAFFVVGTIFWTKVMTDTFSPLGYAMTPIGMYGIAIVLIPVMGFVHRLWVSGDAERREGEAMAAERDRLRTSLLGTSRTDGPRGARAPSTPGHIIFGDDEDEIRRRRREGH